MKLTVSEVEGHVPFEMVQTNVFSPTFIPVIPEVGEAGVVTVAAPVITVHIPVPVIAVFPAKVEVVVQTVWSTPAAATVGIASRIIVTSSLEGEQTPFEIVQRKVFIPTLNPVTPEVGEVGVVIVAPPVMTVHTPVPIRGVFPASVAIVAHNV